jgi:hypothetical protein
MRKSISRLMRIFRVPGVPPHCPLSPLRPEQEVPMKMAMMTTMATRSTASPSKHRRAQPISTRQLGQRIVAIDETGGPKATTEKPSLVDALVVFTVAAALNPIFPSPHLPPSVDQRTGRIINRFQTLSPLVAPNDQVGVIPACTWSEMGPGNQATQNMIQACNVSALSKANSMLGHVLERRFVLKTAAPSSIHSSVGPSTGGIGLQAR